jgi:hypothetical protein
VKIWFSNIFYVFSFQDGPPNPTWPSYFKIICLTEMNILTLILSKSDHYI